MQDKSDATGLGTDLVMIPVLTALAVLVALLSGFKPLLPLLTTAVGYAYFLRDQRRQAYRRCVFSISLWTVALSLTIIGTTIALPQEAGRSIFLGETYQDEMFHWIQTGEGAESNPAQFLPEHLIHFALFAILSLISGGLLGLLLGSVLTGYMSYYVGMLIAHANNPILAALLGWPICSVIRVVAYILAATALASIFFATLRREPINRPLLKRYGLIAGLLLLIDVGLKAWLAPHWQVTLKTLF